MNHLFSYICTEFFLLFYHEFSDKKVLINKKSTKYKSSTFSGNFNLLWFINKIIIFFQYIASNLCGVAFEYWLNGYDTDNSGTFTWIDSQTPSTYTNWYTGQPKDESGNGTEKCIASSTGYTGVWVDIPCSLTRPVVCERNF